VHQTGKLTDESCGAHAEARNPGADKGETWEKKIVKEEEMTTDDWRK